MAPLRVLCVHGYRQSGGSFREKTGALRKLLKKQVELVYLSAPHSVQLQEKQQLQPQQEQQLQPQQEQQLQPQQEQQLQPQQEQQLQEKQSGGEETPAKENGSGSGPGGDEDPRGWWFSDVQARSFNAQQQCEESLGLDESVDVVREAVKVQGPFDGVMGFSQGAAFVAMLCCLQEQKIEPEFNFRFAILVAGFRSACKEHEKFYNAPLQIPSLHVFGLEDRVIPDNMSRELLPFFQDPQVLTHPGGHFVPAASAHRQTYQDFLKRFQ